MLLLLMSEPSYAATLYMGPSENYTNLQAAMSAMSAGDTLIIRNGTYTGSSNTITTYNHPPISSSTWTTIKAETPGGVILDGESSRELFSFIPGTEVPVYWKFDGLIFENSSTTGIQLARADYVKFTRCGFMDPEIGSDAVNVQICAYVLFEDCYSWGAARYHFHFYNVNHSVMRRCIVRHDRGTFGFQIGFQVYNSAYIDVQNCIVIDSNQTSLYNSPSQIYAFKVPQVSSGNINFSGCLALNNAMDFGFVQASDATFTNCVGWGLTGSYGMLSRSTGTVTLNHVTFGNMGTDGFCGDGTTKNIYNSILYGCTTAGLYNWGNGFTSDYNAFYGNGTNYSGVTKGSHDYCSENSNTINPLTNSLKYIVKVEDSSSLACKASDGGNIGATISYKIGKDGTLWGETDYNTTTTEKLWPFPNETLIRSKMCTYTGGGANGSRGFCADGQTLTKYIFEYLGNTMPTGLYGISKPTGVTITILN